MGDEETAEGSSTVADASIGESARKRVVTMLSGGAQGSDTHWSKVAHAAGHSVIHVGFHGHRPNRQALGEHRLVSENDLEANAHMLSRVAIAIGKNEPRFGFIRKLILRNFYQFDEQTSAMYAVVEMLQQGRMEEIRRVPGGTGWTMACYILHHHDPNAYVFAQDVRLWFSWNRNEERWVSLGHGVLPDKKPHDCEGNYAAIGTRKLNAHGIDAINRIFS